MIERLAKALYRLARPYLTVLVATLFNVIVAWAWYTGELSIVEYITAIGPTNGMIIGFWFGERSALKTQGASEDWEDTHVQSRSA